MVEVLDYLKESFFCWCGKTVEESKVAAFLSPCIGVFRCF